MVFNIPQLSNDPADIAKEIANQKLFFDEQENLNYLASTDYLVIKFMETGEAIPADVKEKRQMARDEINRIRQEREAIAPSS